MLQALLRNKLARYDIEDLLTSVVLGSCAYVSHDAALLPFLNKAEDADGKRLGDALGDIESVVYDFWPRWSPVDREFEPGTRAAQPELVLTLTRRGNPKPTLILVEAKLSSGKSSRPTPEGPVNDQLGHYWVYLHEMGLQRGADSVAVVYITPAFHFPQRDFTQTQQELELKGKPRAPLFWLSWCSFGAAVRDAHSASPVPPILRDVIRLLDEKWRLDIDLPSLARRWKAGDDPVGLAKEAKMASWRDLWVALKDSGLLTLPE